MKPNAYPAALATVYLQTCSTVLVVLVTSHTVLVVMAAGFAKLVMVLIPSIMATAYAISLIASCAYQDSASIASMGLLLISVRLNAI
jgi:hypothetical protein